MSPDTIFHLISKQFAFAAQASRVVRCSHSQTFHPFNFDMIFNSFTVLTNLFSSNCRMEIGCLPILKRCFDSKFDLCVSVIQFWSKTQKGKNVRKIISWDCILKVHFKFETYRHICCFLACVTLIVICLCSTFHIKLTCLKCLVYDCMDGHMRQVKLCLRSFGSLTV